MNKIQRSIAGVSLMHTLFQEYKAGELHSSGEIIRKRTAKYMRQRSKTNREEFIDAIMATDRAWRETIEHFVKDHVKIEAKSTIRAIYNY